MVNRPKDEWYRSMTNSELNSFYNEKISYCNNDIIDPDEKALCRLHIDEYRAEIKYREESAKLDREIKEAIAEGVALKKERNNTKNVINTFMEGKN